MYVHNTYDYNSTKFKTIFEDINKVAVARDSLLGIKFDSKNVAVVEAYTTAIKGLNEEEAKYVLSKRHVSEADQSDLLVKAQIISANEGVKASEISRQLVLQGLRKEQADALIEQVTGNEAITSNTILTKEQTTAILEQAEARKLLSVQQRENISNDLEESASSAMEASAEMAQASSELAESSIKLGSAGSILSRGLSQLGTGLKSVLSIFVSSPTTLIATITGSIIGLTYVIGKFQDSAKNAAEAASKFSSSMSSANSTYNQETKTLNELTDKYKELREQLIAAKGNEEETYTIKSQILELQKQLNEIYGDEYDKVNLVTNAYKDQTDELKKNAKQKAENYLNENYDKIEEAKKKMTSDYEYNLGNFSYGLQDANIGNELHKQIKELAKNSGIEWDDQKGFVFKGTAEEASKAINQFMSDIRELQNSQENLPDYFANNFQIFYSDMSKQLGYADEIIQGYQETFETAQMAQIASDSNLSKGYNDAVDAVEKYNEAVAKSDNPYDDENVKKAWDNLQAVKQRIQDNEEEWGQYSNIMDNVFSSASDDAYEFYQSIQNDDSISKLVNDLQGLSDTDLQAMANDGVEDSFDRLCKAAEKYGLDIQDVIGLLLQLGVIQGQIDSGIDTDETDISTRSISQVIDQLNTQLKPTFDALKSAYQDIFTTDDNGNPIFTLENVDLDMLDDIKSTIDKINENKELGITIDYSSFENLANVLTNSSSTADDVHKAINELAGTIIQSLNPSLQATTTESYQLTQSMLESLGVMNSEEVMASALGYSLEELTALRQAASDAGFDLANATDKEISMFIWEQTESGNCAEALYLLQLKKVLLNNTNLNMSSDIEYILGLASSAGIASSALGKLAEAKSMLDTAIKKNDSEGIRRVQSYVRELEGQIKNDVMNFEMPEVDFSPKSDNKNKSSSSKSAKDTTESIVWIERAIENLESEIEKLDKIANSAYASAGLKNHALADQISKVNEEIQLQQQAYEAYMAKAESVGLSDEYKSLVQNGAITIEDITDEDLKKAIDNYTKWYDKAQDTQDKINDLYEKSNDLHVAAFENGANELEKLRDSQAISEREYLDRMTALWEFFYKNQVSLAEVAKEKKLELLDEEKSYLQSVASAASKLLDMQIDSLEDQKDSAVQVYKDQIEAIEGQIDALEEIKKPLQDQLDMMEKARDKEEKILALQKAQYALRRAENQRSQLKYVDGQMIYTTDNKAIKDARKDLDDAKYELTRFNIQQQIDAIDKQIDGLNEQKDKINEIITQTEKYYDAQINGLQKYKDEWQKALDMEELAINMKNFTDMFGENSIGKLLSGDMSLIGQWKQSYLDTLAEIDLTSTGTIGEITKQFADLAGIDLSSTSAQTQDVASQFDTLSESVKAVNSVIGTENKSDNQKSNTENKNEDNSNSLVGAIQSSYDVASEAIPAQVEMMNSYAESIHNVTNEVNELISSIERLNSMSVNAPSLGGNAYASGTKKAEKGLALVAEEKPEAIVNNDGKVVLAEEPTLVNMEGGETVYNGDETEKMLSAKGIRPLREEDNPILYRISHMNPDEVRSKLGIGTYTPAKSFTFDSAKSIANSNVVNNNSKPSYSMNGDVHIHCPGVTKDEVVKQIGDEMTKTFFGMSNKALQRANITR